jgi:DHA2 family multidrug resistance protein
LCALFLVGFLARKVNGKILVSFGFAVFGVSAFMLSRINLDVAMRNIIPANVVNGFGTGFIFVPLTGLALGTLRNEQLANATGIQNLVRNIGGGIGISFITTMLERYAQAHQVILSAQMSPLRPEFQQQLALTQRMFESSFSPADALVHAQATLYRMMLQQASYWAFVQIFFAIACLCGLCVLGVLFFKRVKSTGAVALH